MTSSIQQSSECCDVASKPRGPLFGCDTFVAFPPMSPAGTVVFGKNSDRPNGEGQSIRWYPGQTFPKDSVIDDDIPSTPKEVVRCTYISIPQVPKTYAILICQIDWMWGAEMGANEMGVVCGNEAVWTRATDEPLETKRLLGMDLVRLGLERGGTAYDAMKVITQLLEEFGQGGPCAENDDNFTYHNSFLIADPTEAWILETAGRQWVADRIAEGGRNISNTLTIRTDYVLSSSKLKEYARRHQLWDGGRDDDSPLDWAQCFGDGCVEECASPHSRQSCGRKLMGEHGHGSKQGLLTPDAMMNILRNHESGICMHGGFETTASMVSELTRQRSSTGQPSARYWMMGSSHRPCENEYEERRDFLN
jgi:secernin